MRVREKAHTRQGDSIAATARRRLPMVEERRATPPIGGRGAVKLMDAFEGRRTLIAVRTLCGAPTDRPAEQSREDHVLHHAGPRAFLPAFPRLNLHVLPGTLRRERPLPRFHGLGHALVLSAGLLDALLTGRRSGHDTYGVLPAARRQGVRNLLDYRPRRRGDE